eukprot:gene11445-11591_t
MKVAEKGNRFISSLRAWNRYAKVLSWLSKVPHGRKVLSDLSGLYISKDNGNSWEIFGSVKGLTATHVAALAPHPAGKILVGTGDGIFLVDEECSCARQTYPVGYVSAIVVSDANPDVAYAALHPQYDALQPILLRSDDGGESWQPISNQTTENALPDNLRVVALRVHPVDFDAVVVLSGVGRFAQGPKGAWLSIDGGRLFDRLLWQYPELQSQVMDVVYGADSSNLNKMYLTAFRNGGPGALLHSEDAGSSWEVLAQHTGVILVDSSSARHIRLQENAVELDSGSWEGDCIFWETLDGGASWSSTNLKNTFLGNGWSPAWKTWGFGSGFQGITQTLGSDPTTPNTLLWADSQFVYASSNGGRSWTTVTSQRVGTSSWRSRGIDNAVPVVIAPSGANRNVVYAGYMDMGLWRSDDGGASWTSLNDRRFSGGWVDGSGGNTLTVLPDPARSGVVWASLQGDTDSSQAALVRSSNRGKTWTRLTRGLPPKIKRLQGLSLNPASPRTARTLFVIADYVVYHSLDDGQSWAKVFKCPGSCIFTSVVRGIVWAGGGGGLWRSSSGGTAASWAPVKGLPTGGWTADKMQIEWGFVGLTDLAGSAWQLVLRDDLAYSVAFDADSGSMLCGSSSAYWAGGYSNDSRGVTAFDGVSWREMNQGLAWPFATMVRVVNSVKWAVSPGQGVVKWQ